MDKKLEKAKQAQDAFYKKFEPLIKARAPKMRNLMNGLVGDGSGGYAIRAECDFENGVPHPSKKIQKEVRELVGTTFTYKGTVYPVQFAFAHSDIRAQGTSW